MFVNEVMKAFNLDVAGYKSEIRSFLTWCCRFVKEGILILQTIPIL